MKRALLLADPGSSREPGYGEEIFRDIYKGWMEIETLCGGREISLEQFCTCHTVILHTGHLDAWSRESVGNLIAYVADGGSLMALGEGLHTRRYPEILGLLGGGLKGKSTPCLLDFKKTEGKESPERVESFSLTEEARFYELDPLGESQVLYEMEYACRSYPAVWRRNYAWGRVFCLGFGTMAESFPPPVRKILWEAGLWLLYRT